jgi:hypothetical protein
MPFRASKEVVLRSSLEFSRLALLSHAAAAYPFCIEFDWSA